jgi:ubiquinone/menaquinone biosynthesis C-methylase UbiE
LGRAALVDAKCGTPAPAGGSFLPTSARAPRRPPSYIIASKPVTLAGLQLTGGERVLDLGCGLGDDTFAIAHLVGGQGRAVGVDVSESMILEARRRAASQQLPIEFVIDDAQTLHFEDANFDACRTERMLMHVRDAGRAFAEMVRVIRRGGGLSVFDFDWETQIVDSPYKETTQLIAHSFCDSFKNGWIGRRLPRLFKQHAMTDIRVSPETIFITYPSWNFSSAAILPAQQAGVVSARRLNGGGATCVRRTMLEPSFMHSLR